MGNNVVHVDFGAASPPKPGESLVLPQVLVPEIEISLPAVQTYDTTLAAQKCLELEAAVKKAQKDSMAIKLIRDEPTNQLAASILIEAKRLYKQLEKMRKHFVEPHTTYSHKVNAYFKPYTEPLAEMVARLGRLTSNFALHQETERKRIQAEMDAEAARVAAAQTAEAEAAAKEGVFYEPVKVATPAAPPVSTVTRTGGGSVSQRKEWTFVVENESKVPRKYLVVDPKLIRQDVKGGVREIEGVRIFEDLITNIRT